MSVICKFPQGGGEQNNAPLGLDVYSQINEPKDKYGIWVKTNTKCKNILTNQKIFEDNGTWSGVKTAPGEIDMEFNVDNGNHIVQYKGKLYASLQIKYEHENNNKKYYSYLDYLYSYSNNSWTCETKLDYYTRGMVVHKGKLYIIVGYYDRDNEDNYGTWYLYNDDNTLTNLGKMKCNKFCLYSYNGHIYNCGNVYDESSKKFINRNSNYGLIYSCIYDGKIYGYQPNSHYLIEQNPEKCGCIGKIFITSPSPAKTFCECASFNNVLYIFNYVVGYVYTYNGSTLTHVYTTPSSFNIGGIGNSGYEVTGFFGVPCYGYNKELIYINTKEPNQYIVYSGATEKKFDNGTLIIQKSKDDSYGLYKVALNDKYGIINHFGFDDAFFYGNGGFEWDTEMYYGDGTKWIRFK